jgi:hypothetical protein
MNDEMYTYVDVCMVIPRFLTSSLIFPRSEVRSVICGLFSPCQDVQYNPDSNPITFLDLHIIELCQNIGHSPLGEGGDVQSSLLWGDSAELYSLLWGTVQSLIPCCGGQCRAPCCGETVQSFTPCCEAQCRV